MACLYYSPYGGKVLACTDEDDGEALVEKKLDKEGQDYGKLTVAKNTLPALGAGVDLSRVYVVAGKVEVR